MAVEEELNVNDILLSGPVASEGLPPNHPLLREAQATLKEHLRKRLVNLDERLFELNVERKKLDKEHNEVGQNLYNEQQRVKGFKNQITKLANDEEESKKRRAASEAELRKTIEQLREEEAEVAARKNALFKAQEDYNDLKFALQKAQEHTANLENAIKVHTRFTIR
ncbi:hypothetical protein, conserved [Eimeria maxima]|uniref:Uncharacterized protein n=1 Tax=Eimeria maxima TaxID=5804 RepID=U6M8F7_EIMMA|nr:hypothetical protein, conserved [Eimeria maxima]CDJ60492.1 hypothetical protein, conserved [Eimeria maxima]